MKEQILQILEGIRPDVDFKKENALVEEGVIDSFDIIQIISELNDNFDVNISVDDLLPENFDSADAMAALIARLQNEQ
ncbi:MAG: phosphopantetheine-binding protein [Clostridiales bacterium]|nr:phosphopantetheine-binding protein [Clostridiales bacterium]